jgi:glycosyltransferase involved in cell wall biosynthesis
VPIGMYAAATGLRGSTATTFADFVPAEFPGMLADHPAFVARGRQMSRLLAGSDVIICLSDHVRRRQLPYLVPEPPAEVVVIAPGPPDRGASVRFDPASGDPVGAATALLRQRFPGARAAVPDWWSRPTIVVPSQDRPYKNLPSLIEAVAYLNRREQRMVRIVLTARPDPAHIGRVVEDAGATAFVEFLPDLPDEELDLVLACASLAVTPSLFEGSLPFTLYEAVSVGTPCLMADIPVTRAALAAHPDVEALTVFDATDPRRAAAAIKAALDRRAELLELQRGFVADYYRENSWDACAARYVDVLLGPDRPGRGTS